MLWRCDDGDACIEIEADDAEEAAWHFVNGGDWVADETFWVTVSCEPVGLEDEDGAEDGGPKAIKIKLAVDPEEPPCIDEEGYVGDHVWSLEGTWGHGGGVIHRSVCERCGLLEIEDTWAQDPVDGEQGLTSVKYQRCFEGS